MAKLGLFLLLLLSYVLNMSGTADSAVAKHSSSGGTTTDFIKVSCRATRYPAVCVHSLSGYASAIRQSQRQLAQTALAVSLASARSTSVFMSRMTKVKGIKVREYRAVKDCVENMGDTVDRLSNSMRELEHMGQAIGQDFMWHMSNVQTWVSAALTDENTCIDGFAERNMEGHVKTAIKRRINNVAQVTSNALALVNRFAEKHKMSSAAISEP